MLIENCFQHRSGQPRLSSSSSQVLQAGDFAASMVTSRLTNRRRRVCSSSSEASARPPLPERQRSREVGLNGPESLMKNPWLMRMGASTTAGRDRKAVGGRHAARECRGLDMGEHRRAACRDRHAGCALLAALHSLTRRVAAPSHNADRLAGGSTPPTSTPVASGASTSHLPAAARM
jgi:hypothetical protein